jgi:microcystin-dependent protein
MVGDTKTSMVRVDHLGWLVCDGRSLLRSEYRNLFAVLGTDFGPGDVPGSTFNLPDAQGRVVGLIGAAVDVSDRIWLDGEISGDYVHTLTIAEIPAHNHDICGGMLNIDNSVVPSGNGNTSITPDHDHGITDPGHTHNYLNITDTAGSGAIDDAAGSGSGSTTTSNTTNISVNSAGAHQHQIASNGGSLPHNNIQPTLFMGNLFVYCGQPGKNITQADGISLPAAGVRSYYPPSAPANLLY